ncbi:ABC transporter permease [Bacillus sp. FJAT-50079]|uniref:ABC transporter permease n=1 Tax=Bacillus sp. FJAT-50079 TaxID=2833577 RepID=UPI001BC8EC26|nr:ABC transporter permease [Bacillus sp. FJAT-50079]MBS4208640.1 ABC transporter permease [Bacillus sp. FJAT-50079]
MLPLLKFELYKIYRQKSIYLLFTLLLVIISLGLHMDRDRERDVYLLYKPWEGKITEGKIAQLKKFKIEIEKKSENGTGTWSLEDQVRYGISESFSSRKQNAEMRAQEITMLTNTTDLSTSSFEKRNTELHKKLLSTIDTSLFYYQKGPSQMIDMIYTFGFVITAFMLIIGISPIFSKEYSSGMDQFLLSSKYGRSKAVTAKLLAAMIFTLPVIVGWIAYSVATSLYAYGNHGWNAPLQSIHAHYYAPYPLTLGESYVIMLFMHTIAAISFALIIVFVSAICKRVLTSLLVSGFIFGIPFAINVIPGLNWLEEVAWSKSLLNLSTYHLMKVKNQWLDFSTFNLIGYPILYPIVAVVFSLTTIMVFIYLTKWVMKKKQVTM